MHPPLHLLPVILPLLTLHIHLTLGVTGFPPAAHMWLAVTELVIMLPAALLAGKFDYRYIATILAMSLLANESASHLSASFATVGVAGTSVSLWVMFVLLVGLKSFALTQAYMVLQTVPSKA